MSYNTMIKIISRSGVGVNPFYPIFGSNRPTLVLIDSARSRHRQLMPLNMAGCIVATVIIFGHDEKLLGSLLTASLITSTILRLILTKTITIKSSEIISTKGRLTLETIDHFLYYFFISMSMFVVADLGGYRESTGLILSIFVALVSVVPIINIIYDKTKRILTRNVRQHDHP